MIGVGAIIEDDWKSIWLMIYALSAFSIGWILFNTSVKAIGVLRSPSPIVQSRFHNKSVIYWIVIIFLSLVFIEVFYGLPLLAQDPSVARLNQRSYWPLLSGIEYFLPALTGVAYLVSQSSRNKKLLIFTLVFALIASTLLAVRYIFLEVFVVLIVLYFMHNNFNRNLKITLISIFLGGLFFAAVQYLRSGDDVIDNLFDMLFQRFFLINHTIFSASVNNHINLPIPTYVTPFVKLFGDDPYNIGFILFNEIETNNPVQGYAPPSLIGEIFINFHSYFMVGVVAFTVGMWLSLLTTVLYLITPNEYRLVLKAFVCMEMFRLYAHTTFGASYALALFSASLILIWVLSNHFAREYASDSSYKAINYFDE